jgi:hypothetical protein
MALRKPTVMINGQLQDLPTADTISVSSVTTDVSNLTNGEAAAVAIGFAVYIFSAATFKKAQANAAATARVVGLVNDVTITNGVVGAIATDGPLTATTGQWDAATGQTGGLTINTIYYLDPTTAGKITPTAPTAAGQYVVPVGIAFSTTQLDVSIGASYLLA